MPRPALRATCRLPYIVLFCMVAACVGAGGHRPLDERAYPGELRPPEALARDVMWRQRVKAIWNDERHGFDAVVQKQGSELTVLGLSPTGSTGFAAILRDGDLELVDRMPEPLPIPARFVLLDVQRALYPWLPGGVGPLGDGEHAGEVDGERVVESWRDGRLRERRFTRLDNRPAGSIVVRYTDGYAPGSMPPPFTLDNEWFGYRLHVETLDEARLPADTDDVP